MADDQDLVAYCGLYCGDCFSYNGEIAGLAKELRRELRSARFEKVAEAVPFKALKNYRGYYDALGAMVKLRCARACRGGGGNPFCQIRKCCQANGRDGCWECAEFEGCRQLDFLKKVHGEACRNNLRRIRRQGKQAFVDGKRDW